MSKQKRDYHIGQRVGRNRTRASLRLYAGILPLNYNPKRRYPSQIHARHPSGPDGQVVPSRTAWEYWRSSVMERAHRLTTGQLEEVLFAHSNSSEAEKERELFL